MVLSYRGWERMFSRDPAILGRELLVNPDLRAPLAAMRIAMIVGAIRRQLVARAEARRQFPRAVIDRALVDLIDPD